MDSTTTRASRPSSQRKNSSGSAQTAVTRLIPLNCVQHAEQFVPNWTASFCMLVICYTTLRGEKREQWRAVMECSEFPLERTWPKKNTSREWTKEKPYSNVKRFGQVKGATLHSARLIRATSDAGIIVVSRTKTFYCRLLLFYVSRNCGRLESSRQGPSPSRWVLAFYWLFIWFLTSRFFSFSPSLWRRQELQCAAADSLGTTPNGFPVL